MEEKKEAEVIQEQQKKTNNQQNTENQIIDPEGSTKLEAIRNSRTGCYSKPRKKSPRFTPVRGEKKRWSLCSPEPRVLPLEVVKLLTPCK